MPTPNNSALVYTRVGPNRCRSSICPASCSCHHYCRVSAARHECPGSMAVLEGISRGELGKNVACVPRSYGINNVELFLKIELEMRIDS